MGVFRRPLRIVGLCLRRGFHTIAFFRYRNGTAFGNCRALSACTLCRRPVHCRSNQWGNGARRFNRLRGRITDVPSARRYFGEDAGRINQAAVAVFIGVYPHPQHLRGHQHRFGFIYGGGIGNRLGQEWRDFAAACHVAGSGIFAGAVVVGSVPRLRHIHARTLFDSTAPQFARAGIHRSGTAGQQQGGQYA